MELVKVSGAGSNSVNGLYIPSETDTEKYIKENGDEYIEKSAPTIWSIIGYINGSPYTFYYNDDADVDGGTYVVESGSSPAPTVEIVEGRNYIKEKEIKSSYDELEASNSKYKAGSFKYELEAQEGTVALSKERVGF